MTIINQLFPGSISGLFELRHELSMRFAGLSGFPRNSDQFEHRRN